MAETRDIAKPRKRRRRPPASGTEQRVLEADASESHGKTVKKSVTLRESVVEEIEARTGVRGFSEFLNAAAERHLALLQAQEIVDDHVTRHGEFTQEELAEAEAAWRGE
ncbi:hypothetical protein [Actinomadura sp. 3N407]|jgi:hypothetical protein|uniref:hypothetical protein n=1 Tax=Actinomadura sp. 3N407 TaxID=3457423 RepID=UPI003FCCDF34